jgi:hypothetical protein
MIRITGLLVGIAALGVAALGVVSYADAADGCGRGWFYNGRRCVPMDGPGYGPPRGDLYGAPPRGEFYGSPPPGRYSGPPDPGLNLQLGIGRRDERRYFPPNPALRTWNHCPQGYTVQDGLCKPYSGR